MGEEINFCPNCGQDQHSKNITAQKSSTTFLTVLCILTIVGSVFTILRSVLYEMISMMDSNSNYIRGWIYAGSSIGTLIGAILMLQKKLKGLYLYSVFQAIYIITVLFATFVYGDIFKESGRNNEMSTLAFTIAMFFLVPSIFFLVSYWKNPIKKHLK